MQLINKKNKERILKIAVDIIINDESISNENVT